MCVWLCMSEIYPNVKKILKFVKLWVWKQNFVWLFLHQHYHEDQQNYCGESIIRYFWGFPINDWSTNKFFTKDIRNKKIYFHKCNLDDSPPLPSCRIFFLVMSCIFLLQSFRRYPSPRLCPANNPCWLAPSKARHKSDFCHEIFAELPKWFWGLAPEFSNPSLILPWIQPIVYNMIL